MSFEPRSEADVLRLIEEYPLAWVVCSSGAGFGATPLPLLAETDAGGRVSALIGHFASSNPQVALLRAAPRATILFSGPQGYISPELVSQPRWAPTWNYATAQFDVEVEFRPEENDAALEQLVTRMERDRRDPWTIARMGERYAQLVSRIIAFRAHVRTGKGRFKLGQDESPRTLSELLAGLDNPELVRWMKDFNS
ncbi:MAG TPA: FMN-binding negative transcriptional regulator [Steroidobacteraceae bacterium]|nr:FMN-binding negative transcriptional regulator [Steroidobacteraceae bacterium]